MICPNVEWPILKHIMSVIEKKKKIILYKFLNLINF